MALANTDSTALAARSVHLDPAAVPALLADLIGQDMLFRVEGHLNDAAQVARIDDATDYQLALDVASMLKGDIQDIEAACEPLVSAFNKMHKAATGCRGQMTIKAEAEARRLAGAATTWRTEEERKAREEAARIQREEAARLLAEQVKRDEAAIEEANALAANGQHEDARAEEVEAEKLAPAVEVLAAPILPAGVTTAGIGRVTWKARVTDKNALIYAAIKNPFLAAFLIVDEAALNKLASSQRAEMRIPGVEAYPEQSTAIRASR